MIGDWEVPRIASVESLERRAFAELPVPGRVGSLFQDTNSEPMRLAISGSLFGDEARDEFLQALRERFAAGEPVTFVADIVTATSVQYVVIEELSFVETGRRPDELAYRVALRESPPPPPPPSPLGGLDAGLLDQANALVDSVSGALDVLDTLGSVPDIGNPTEPVRSVMDQVRTATAGVQEGASLLGGLFGGEGG
jgi:hypothetical protein